jgi:hypothetical protein
MENLLKEKISLTEEEKNIYFRNSDFRNRESDSFNFKRKGKKFFYNGEEIKNILNIFSEENEKRADGIANYFTFSFKEKIFLFYVSIEGEETELLGIYAPLSPKLSNRKLFNLIKENNLSLNLIRYENGREELKELLELLKDNENGDYDYLFLNGIDIILSKF